MEVFNGMDTFGNERVGYPDKDPAKHHLKCFTETREKILSAIKEHWGTPVVEKYTWRIRPFNYMCEQIALNPTRIAVLCELIDEEKTAFSTSLRNLKINNLGFESN